jgi:hypothetical protein
MIYGGMGYESSSVIHSSILKGRLLMEMCIKKYPSYFVYLVFSVLLLTSCTAPKEFIHINPEPEKSAWFLRAQYSPNGIEIRGIPVSKINPDWCAANELKKDEYLGKLSQHEKNGIENLDDINFSITGKFDGKAEMTAVTGIYKTCSGDLGNFLLVIKENDNKNEFVSLLNLSNQPAFTTLHKSNEDNKIRVWWCLNCDGISTLYWNEDKNGFDTKMSDAELQELTRDMQHVGSEIDASGHYLAENCLMRMMSVLQNLIHVKFLICMGSREK